jgi:hypothetical protein
MENQGAKVTGYHWRFAATPRNSKYEFKDAAVMQCKHDSLAAIEAGS